ncbi:hypothetical protein Tco_1486204, partial [Tanacetum coccineum]
MDCIMLAKEIENEPFKEVEKLEWWFEQDIDDEGGEDEKKEVVMKYDNWLEAVGRRVKDTEKEAESRSFVPPVGGPISSSGSKYIKGPP